MILNMVLERYPRAEDVESGGDEVLTTSAQILESSTLHDQIVFGSFESSIKLGSHSSIEPEFDRFSIKIGEISCVLVD